MADKLVLNAVLAHSMLGTLAAIKGAVQTSMVLQTETDETADGLLMMALRRMDFLTEQVRSLALGLPDEVVLYLDELQEHVEA